MAPLTSKKIPGEKRDAWSDHETNALVDNFILKKDIITGSYSATVTKEAKKAAWEYILDVIQLECPDSKPRTVEEIKKKWNNLKTAAMKDISAYRESMTGTGGGPGFELKPVYEKMYTELFKKDNPSLNGVDIPGSVDTEAVSNDELLGLLQLVENGKEVCIEVTCEQTGHYSDTPCPSTPFPDNQLSTHIDETESVMRSSVSSTPASTSGSRLSITPSLPSTSSGSSTPSGSSSLSGKNKRLISKPMSVNQVIKKTKFAVCEDTATSASFHVKERRLKVLLLAIQVRRELGVPFSESELPDDLHRLLFNLADEL